MKIKIALFLVLIMILTGCQLLTLPSDTPNGENQGEYTMTDGTKTLIKYPEYPDGAIPKDYDYTVRVIQGNEAIEIPVYNPVYASDYFTTDVYNFDMHRRYAEFAFTGEPVTVEITAHMEFDRYTVMPSSKAIPSKINDNVITYTLTEPCTTVLKLNNDKDTHLTIFAEAPDVEKPDKNDKNVVYYEAGYHEVENGVINLHSNQTLYLEAGALVKARLNVSGQNIKVCGHGAFIEPAPIRQFYGGSSYMCMLNASSNVTIEDVRFLDAHTYNIVTTNGRNLNFDGVKFLCNQVSTDGLSIWDGAYNMHLNNCYFNISDNAFVIGGGNVEDFLVENTIVITDYSFIFPQGKLTGDPLVFKNIDVLRYNTFITHHYPNQVGNKSVDLVLENCTAIDSDKAGDFIISRYGGAASKNYILKNVSVPKIADYNYWSDYISTTDGSYTGDDVQNVSITFDNVWVGGEPITKELIASKDTLDYSKNNTVTYLDTVDESAVTIKRNDITLKKKVKPYIIYIGDRRIECKYQPYKEYGKLYVSAYEILEALLFKDIKVEEGKLTFSYKDEKYEMEIADEKAMVDIGTLSKTINTKIKTKGNRINVTNIKRDDNLLRDPDFELGLSTNWVTRNFTMLYLSEKAQSGNYAIRVTNSSWGNIGGIYQDIADVVRQHGKGQYLVTAWVKRATPSSDSKNIKLLLSDGWENVIDSKNFRLTDEWQKIEFTFTQVSTDFSKGLMLVIGHHDGSSRNVLVDNVSMTKIN